MGKRQLNRLSARTVASVKQPGLYCDGGGLYLQLSPSGSKTWIFRYRSPVTRKLRDMGLGPVHSVGLPEAREKATTQRSLLLDRLDPIDVREGQNRKRAIEAAKTVTFSQCAASYIESHRPGWRNEKHGDQWENTIAAYCHPVIGALPVQEVDTRLVLKILEPIWASKPETATRLRGRIENILDWAKARGYRSAENPARWKGHLNQILPALTKKHRVKHHKAMPFAEVGAFVSKLRGMSCVSAPCLEFTILTATRTNEAVAAKPKELEDTVRAVVKVDEFISGDKAALVDVISKVTGLDKAIATGAVDNLDPDPKMYRASAVAIAGMMRDLKYINSDVSAAVEKNMDYRFLEAATGKPKSELGY